MMQQMLQMQQQNSNAQMEAMMKMAGMIKIQPPASAAPSKANSNSASISWKRKPTPAGASRSYPGCGYEQHLAGKYCCRQQSERLQWRTQWKYSRKPSRSTTGGSSAGGSTTGIDRISVLQLWTHHPHCTRHSKLSRLWRTFPMVSPFQKCNKKSKHIK